MNIMISKPHLKETTALQIIAVIAWLWVVPVIDLLESHSYGSATRALITSFLPFVVGVLIASYFPKYVTSKRSMWSLISGCVVLLLSLVLYALIFQKVGLWFHRNCVIFRVLGFVLLGYGLSKLKNTHKPVSFKGALLLLVCLYAIYNLLIWVSHSFHPDSIFLYFVSIMIALDRIAIVIVLWKTLSADSVIALLSKFPKISLFLAGLFWGMILVVPADSYAPRWLSILMLFLAPVFAYIMTVIVRLSVKLISYVVKGLIENIFWYFESCCWWINKTDEV